MMIFKNVLAICLVVVSLSSCLKNTSDTSVTYIPRNDGSGWIVSTPAQENLDVNILKSAYEKFYSNAFPLGTSLMVFRNGRIVSEGYKTSSAANSKANTMSCTKSVVSLLCGIALDQGLFSNIDESISLFYPDIFSSFSDVTIRSCLTMTAGIGSTSDVSSQNLIYAPQGSLKYISEQPRLSDTGTFFYSDYPPQIVGGIISLRSGITLDSFAAKYLFAPLGISDFSWDKGKDGLNFGGFSLFLKPKDLAKVGQLCLQGGKWNNQTVVSKSWVDKATSSFASNSNYGFLFWTIPSKAAFEMKGKGEQLVYIAPSKGLVIVYTSAPYSDESLWGDGEGLMNLVYSACN